MTQVRTAPGNNCGSQSSYSNDYSSGSTLTRSSSTYGGDASNDFIQLPRNTGGYGRGDSDR